MIQPLVLVLGIFAAAEPTAKTQEGPPQENSSAALRLVGRWVLDKDGNPVSPRDFERGIQTGALVFRSGELWSMGDQRAEWPGQLLRIDPKTGRLLGDPIRPALKEPPGGNPEFEVHRSIWNPDYEGLSADPKDPSVLYGVTEDKKMWIVRFRLSDSKPPAATIDQITELEFPEVKLYPRESSNYRLEGIALSDDGKTLYIAWERTEDNLPRVFCLPAEEGISGKPVRPKLLPVDFAAVKPRPDKPKTLLNLNDILFLRSGGRAFLLALARDQERLLRIDIEKGAVDRIVDLDFRDPDGDSMMWVSPEGLAVDAASDRLWIINDPDSVRGNYRKAKDEGAQGNFAAMAPLLFEMKLSEALGAPAKS